MEIVRRGLLAAAIAGGACFFSPAWAASDYQGTVDDYVQINQLAPAYSAGFDDKNMKAWSSIWTDNAMLHGHGICAIGHQQIVDFMAKIAARPVDPTKLKDHHVSSMGIIVYSDRDHATAHSFVQVVNDFAPGMTTPPVNITGTYDDKFERVNGHWLLADRYILAPNDKPSPCPR